MKLVSVLLFFVSLSSQAAENLHPAFVKSAQGKIGFPITSYVLTVEVPCHTKEISRLATVTKDNKLVIGAFLTFGQPLCNAEPKDVQVEITAFTDQSINEVIILGQR